MKKGDTIQRTLDGGDCVQALVNWVVEDDIGYSYLPNQTTPMDELHGCGKISEGVWEVILSADPTYQSTVDNMSIKEIQDSIEVLRGQRSHMAKPKVRGATVSRKMSPMEKALAKLSPEKREELKRKLGLVD